MRCGAAPPMRLELSRRKLLKLGLAAGATLAGVVLAGYYWLDRKLNPRTSLHYRFPLAVRAVACVGVK